MIVPASIAGAARAARARRAAAARSAADRRDVRSRAGPTCAARVTVIAIDAGVARPDHQRHRRRPAAEFRPDPRRRRRPSSGDAASDVGRSGLGGGRDRQAAAEERRPLGGDLPARGRRRRVQLLPDYCFAHGLERFGFLVEQSHTSATLRTRTLWSILSTEGFSVGVVGWPLTQPAPACAATWSSDAYHRGRADAVGHRRSVGVYPPELQPDALPRWRAPGRSPAGGRRRS